MKAGRKRGGTRDTPTFWSSGIAANIACALDGSVGVGMGLEYGGADECVCGGCT